MRGNSVVLRLGCHLGRRLGSVDPEVGFKLHVIYGATVSPSEEAYATINESPEGTLI